jgi:hypothetical protein
MLNPDVHYQMDRIRTDIDNLGLELEKFTSAPVELNANFIKFGWSANVRTHLERDDVKPNVKFGDIGETTATSGKSLTNDGKPGSGRSARESTTIKVWADRRLAGHSITVPS